MKNKECVITQELLPLYVEDICSPEANDLIAEHLETCRSCNETYRKMKTNMHLTTETAKPNKRTIWYLNGIKGWYLLCPLLAFVFLKFDLQSILYAYEGILILLTLLLLASELFHRGTWWDTECINLQEEGRNDAKRKWGVFYSRPIWLAIPSIAVVAIMELPRFIDFVTIYIL